MDKSLPKKIEQLRLQRDITADRDIRRAIDRAWSERQTKMIPAPMPGWRFLMNKKLTLSTLAALLIAAVVIGILPLGTSRPAWADVIKPILQARTAVLTYVIGEGGPGTEITDRVKGNRINRLVSTGGPQEIIIDMETSKILVLDSNTKTAVTIGLENMPDIPNYMERLRNLRFRDIGRIRPRHLVYGIQALASRLLGKRD